MGVSSSSSNTSGDKKFIEIGEELIGEDEKVSQSVNIYEIRFLQPKVIDRIIVQLRIELKVGSLVWIILRNLEDFRQLKKCLELPADFYVSFPKTDQRFFRENSEIISLQTEISKWFLAAAKVCLTQKPMLCFLGLMNDETSEAATTTIDLSTLINTCETGDILLFKTTGLIPSSIRKITRSKYDHIGVVIVRVQDGGGRKACFLEASGDEYGVDIHELRDRLQQWYLADATICYRRLRCVRDERFQKSTESFINSVQGCKYGLSVKAMVLNKKDKDPQKKKHFFCSELVTAYYKHLGFIGNSAKSHNYVPGDFAEKKSGSRLNLINAILEHEVMLTKWPKRENKALPSLDKLTRTQSDRECLRKSCLSATTTKMNVHRRKSHNDLSPVRVIDNGKLLNPNIFDNYWSPSNDFKRAFSNSSPFM